MEFQEIQELIKLVAKNNLSEVSINRGDFKLVIKGERKEKTSFVQNSSPMMFSSPAPQLPIQTQSAPSASESPKQAEPVSDSKPAANSNAGLIEIKSPIVGTFYRSSGPDKPIFAKVGDVIQKGQVLCIVEAMKLFNEIEAEISGKVVKVMLEDASPVEYDQVLFLIDPKG
jgi:acetyl-CoA carboxylase biotin carboxyl carrier protein